MKKNCLKAMCLALALACMPVPVMAATTEGCSCVNVCSDESVSPRADIIYYVHSYLNGVRMHRLWNETKGEWVGLWSICDCK